MHRAGRHVLAVSPVPRLVICCASCGHSSVLLNAIIACRLPFQDAQAWCNFFGIYRGLGAASCLPGRMQKGIRYVVRCQGRTALHAPAASLQGWQGPSRVFPTHKGRQMAPGDWPACVEHWYQAEGRDGQGG